MGGEKGLIAPHFAFERTGGLSGNDFWDVLGVFLERTGDVGWCTWCGLEGCFWVFLGVFGCFWVFLGVFGCFWCGYLSPLKTKDF
jgi:hypothetical protein